MILKSIKLLISKKKTILPFCSSSSKQKHSNRLQRCSDVNNLHTIHSEDYYSNVERGEKKVGGATLGWLHLEMDEMSLFQAWLLLDMPMHKVHHTTYTSVHTHIRIHKIKGVNKN